MDLRYLDAPLSVCLYRSEFVPFIIRLIFPKDLLMSLHPIQSLFAHLAQFIMYFSSIWYFFPDLFISTKDQARAVFSVSRDVL